MLEQVLAEPGKNDQLLANELVVGRPDLAAVGTAAAFALCMQHCKKATDEGDRTLLEVRSNGAPTVTLTQESPLQLNFDSRAPKRREPRGRSTSWLRYQSGSAAAMTGCGAAGVRHVRCGPRPNYGVAME